MTSVEEKMEKVKFVVYENDATDGKHILYLSDSSSGTEIKEVIIEEASEDA